MTFDEMCQFVRLHADADVTDAPTSNLQVYARMAYNDILSRRTGWPHLEAVYTFTTVPGQSDYQFTSFSTNDLEIVTGVVDTSNIGRRLVAITRSDADLIYAGPNVVGASNAVHYAVRKSFITLYPQPTTAITYTVLGYRTPTAWPVGAADTPDLPRAFDEAICFFMLSQYYMSQEDPQMSGVYMGTYQQIVDRQVRAETTRNQGPKPNVMGGANIIRNGFMDRVKGILE